jgi:hypothetical protein
MRTGRAELPVRHLALITEDVKVLTDVPASTVSLEDAASE